MDDHQQFLNYLYNYFADQNAREKIENVRNTTLMAFFELCSRDDFSRTLLSIEFPLYYTFVIY